MCLYIHSIYITQHLQVIVSTQLVAIVVMCV